MPEKLGFRPEKPDQPDDRREEKENLFDGVIFTEATRSRGWTEYRSSAPDRKIMILSPDSARPQEGRDYKVRVVEDTNPENPMEGKLIVEIIIDPEEQKRRAVELAEEARQALAGNDFAAALQKLREIQEQAVPDAERSPESVRELREAKEIFGENFVGIEEIEKFRGLKFSEQEKKNIARMWTEKVKEQKLTKEDLEQLEKEGFMVMLRSGTIEHERKEIPATLGNLREKFKDLFYNQDWYNDEKFVKEDAVKLAWAIVKKEVLEESRSKDWDEQEEILKQWAKEHKVDPKFVTRRMPAEVAYDILAYYSARNERILENDWDWTAVRSSDGEFVSVGSFDADGLSVYGDARAYSRSDLGVCPAR